MRYSLQIPYQDEKQFLAVYARSAFRVHYLGQDTATGSVSVAIELPNCSDKLDFLRKILATAGPPRDWAGRWTDSTWLSSVERLYMKELNAYGEGPAKFLESFSKEMEAASKKILKEEAEQKAKEQEEQKAKEEEDRKLKEIKDEEDAKLTALISYFYNRN